MSVQMLGRCASLLFLVAAISACSSAGGGSSNRSIQCQMSPSSCMHEGSYEPGEEEFAEQEAKDLNRAASKKLRRSGWW
ncbi:hypothetical protein ERE07_00650 [Allopusillimonas ginsengisoli]|nr:hypothetical protein ERE07_00650 [Allopusillimonas ginsengisoli]